LWKALQRVRQNKGSCGIDGMTVKKPGDYLKKHWPSIREQLVQGDYQPQPVKQVEIANLDGGGLFRLGGWQSNYIFYIMFGEIGE